MNLIKRNLFLFIVVIVSLFLFNNCNDNPIDDDLPPCPPHDIVARPPYDSPTWHPSGEFIGFNHTPLLRINYPYGEHCQGAYEWDPYQDGFWLINTDGTNMRRIFPYKLRSPAWSPDGEWIAFSLPIGNEVHIFKMKFTGNGFDTTSIVQLTTEGRNFFPAWSPDGQWIVYDSNVNSPNGMNFIWKMKSDGSQKTRIAYDPTKGEIRMPSWSKDQQWIYYIGLHNEIFKVKVSDTSEVIKLTHLNENNIYATDNRNPNCSPEGTRIAFWSNGNIWLMDSVGNNQQQLTTAGVDVSFGTPFSWSPDGVYIAYTDFRPDDWGYYNGTLWILNTNTGEKKQLTFNPKPNN